jgi:2-polyprenyl-3-methyl-5-hydroxy-6-metoxy-1,4-benzoquinol methylase
MIAGAVFCRFCHHKVKNGGKMQKRHNDRYRYFKEEAATAEKYFIPYISRYAAVEGRKVLEVGCGEGGNLLPFARMGCSVTGVDVSELRISQASDFFSREGIGGKFVCADILDALYWPA